MSAPYNYVTTSIAWAPSGEYFAVGSFDMIKLCNKTGWTYSFNKIDSGSLFKLSWSSDGTTLAGAGVKNKNKIKLIYKLNKLKIFFREIALLYLVAL